MNDTKTGHAAAPSLDVVRRIFIVIGMLAILVGVANVVVNDWTSEATAGDPYDFGLNWVAAQRLVDSEPLYDRAASLADGLRLVGPSMLDTNHNPFSSFIGLPTTALLYAPFTVFDYETAGKLFRLTAVLAMFAAIGVATLALPSASRLPAGLIGVGAALVSTPFIESIFLGQVDGFLMLGLALAFVGVAHDRWGLVGFGIGIAALLKISPAILLVYLALRHKWRAVWFGIGTVAVLLVVAAAVGRFGDLFDWLDHVMAGVGDGARNTDNQAIPAALARLWGGDDLKTQLPLGSWRILSYVIVAAGVAGLWWIRRHKPIEPLELGVLVLVALLAGPLSWDHYTVWSILVVVLIVDPRRWAGRRWAEIGVLAVALAGAMALMRIFTIMPEPREVADQPLLRLTSSAKTAALLLLLAVALRLLLRPAPEEADDQGPTRLGILPRDAPAPYFLPDGPLRS